MPTEEETQHLHPYLYTNINFPTPVTWTLGVSYDDYVNGPIEVVKTNPKLGVRWEITDALSVRAAAFRWIKPPLVADRTLEPTQVSGFNQVFDDSNGDETWRRGAGIDWRITKRLFAGAETTRRDIDVPIGVFVGEEESAIFETHKEKLDRVYLFWTPTSRISLSGQVVYDTFKSETGILTSFSAVPEKLKTFSVPVGARYFDPSGFFAGVGVTYIDQEIVRTPEAEFIGFSDGRDHFFVVDASIGWRFPKRYGIATLTAKNLTDEKFFYQDDSFRAFQSEPSTGPYVPERQVIGRVTLYF